MSKFKSAYKSAKQNTFVESTINNFNKSNLLSESISHSSDFYQSLTTSSIFRIIQTDKTSFTKEYNQISEGIFSSIKNWFSNKKDTNTDLQSNQSTELSQTQAKLDQVKSQIFDWFSTTSNTLYKLRSDLNMTYFSIENQDKEYSDKFMPTSLLNAVKAATEPSKLTSSSGNFFQLATINMNQYDKSISKESLDKAVQLEVKSATIGGKNSLGKSLIELVNTVLFNTKMFDSQNNQGDNLDSIIRYNQNLKPITILAILVSISTLPQTLAIMEYDDNTNTVIHYSNTVEQYNNIFNIHSN